MCKERLRQWHNAIIDSQGSKLRSYKLFKDSFTREPYLKILNCFQLRKVVAKFRCSDHRLEIEMGRHKKIKVEERICQLCKCDVETETHFLQECPVYANLRTKYLGNIEGNDWTSILKCKDKVTAFNSSKFLNQGL